MNNELSEPAKLLGKKSWESRSKGKTKQEIKEMMSALGKKSGLARVKQDTEANDSQ